MSGHPYGLGLCTVVQLRASTLPHLLGRWVLTGGEKGTHNHCLSNQVEYHSELPLRVGICFIAFCLAAYGAAGSLGPVTALGQ